MLIILILTKLQFLLLVLWSTATFTQVQADVSNATEKEFPRRQKKKVRRANKETGNYQNPRAGFFPPPARAGLTALTCTLYTTRLLKTRTLFNTKQPIPVNELNAVGRDLGPRARWCGVRIGCVNDDNSHDDHPWIATSSVILWYVLDREKRRQARLDNDETTPSSNSPSPPLLFPPPPYFFPLLLRGVYVTVCDNGCPIDEITNVGVEEDGFSGRLWSQPLPYIASVPGAGLRQPRKSPSPGTAPWVGRSHWWRRVAGRQSLQWSGLILCLTGDCAGFILGLMYRIFLMKMISLVFRF